MTGGEERFGRWPWWAAAAVVVAAAFWLHPGPGSEEADETRSAGNAEAELSRTLARECSGCHRTPRPDLLPRSAWETFLGRKHRVVRSFVRARGLDSALLIPRETLDAVTAAVLEAAPTQRELVGPPRDGAGPAGIFDPIASRPIDERDAPMQGYTDVYVDRESGRVLLSDVMGGGLQLVDFSGGDAGFARVGITPGRIEPAADGFLVTLMEDPEGGKVRRLDLEVDDPTTSEAGTLVGGLQRPIRAYPARLGGKRGIVVEEFGIDRGGLSFWPRTRGGGVADEPRRIVDSWGVLGSGVVDLDENGTGELAVLVSQEAEKLLLFPDAEESIGDPRLVHQGHPGYGFNGLTLADVDGDGRTDLVTTNGDNYDLESGPLKPYHGVRIFLNQGDLSFSDPIFLPLHGAIDVVVADFDQDDDADLAAVSAFPDRRVRPYRSAVLFEQVGEMEFERRSIEPARGSRWVAAARADLDGDGTPDLVLAGAHSTNSPADRRWSEMAGPEPLKMLMLRAAAR